MAEAADPSTVVSILDLVTRAGPYGLFILTLWWLKQERSERLEAQKRERDLTRELLASHVKTTNAIRSLRYVLLHGKAPTADEYEAEDVG